MILIICCTVILILELYFIYKNSKVDKCLFLYFVFSSFLWVIIPSLLTLIDNSGLHNTEYSRDIFVKYAFYEFLLYIIVLFLFNMRPQMKIIYYGKKIANNIHTFNLFWCFFFVVILINILVLLSTTVTYSDINDVFYKEKQNTNFLSIFTNYAISFFFISLFYYKEYLGYLKLIITYLILFANIVVVVLQGSRMQLILLFFILVFFILKSESQKRIKYIVYLFILITFSSMIIPVIAGIRNYGKISISKVADALKNTSEENTFIFQLVLKLNSINTGSTLVEEEEHPYLIPYLNSFSGAIPNFIYPGKRPVAGSSNGEYNGLPSRIAAVHVVGDSRIANVGVSTSARALWQGGWMFYLLTILVLFFWFRYLNTLLIINHFYGKMLALYLALTGWFIFPTGDMMITELVKQPMFYLFFIFLASFNSLIKVIYVNR